MNGNLGAREDFPSQGGLGSSCHPAGGQDVLAGPKFTGRDHYDAVGPLDQPACL